MNTAPSHSVVVTGAASQVGCFLLPRLADSGMRAMAVSRRPGREAAAVFGPAWTGHGVTTWIQADLDRPLDSAWSDGCDTWIHLGPLQLVSRVLGAGAAPPSESVCAG